MALGFSSILTSNRKRKSIKQTSALYHRLPVSEKNKHWVGWFVQYYSGWWFQTFFIFHNIWDVILPIDFHIFQRGSNHQPVLDVTLDVTQVAQEVENEMISGVRNVCRIGVFSSVWMTPMIEGIVCFLFKALFMIGMGDWSMI